MLNRNAARHLILVVSILLCFFIYMGYRLFGREDDAPAPAADPETGFAVATADPGSYSLLPPPGGASPAALRPPPPSAPVDDWVPSVSESVPDMASLPEVVIPAPPGGGASFADAAGASPLPEAIIGLIPAPPGDAAPAGIRPPSGALPPGLIPPGASASPASGTGMPLDDFTDAAVMSAPPPFLPPSSGSGQGPASSPGYEPVSSSSPQSIPPFGASSPVASAAMDDEPPVFSPPPFSSPAAGDDTSSYASPDTEEADYPYQTSADGTLPPPGSAMRPPAPATPLPAAESRPPAPLSSTPPVRVSAPSDPVREYDDGYDEYSGYDDMEEDMPSGSESLRIYVVRAGDTLSNIAARELGSISLADNIFLLNRDVIDDPDHLMAGVKIRLPVRGGQIAAEVGGGDVGGGVRRPTSGTGRVHTVARGDTLSSIAAQYYGSSSAWRFLYEANRNIVPNPNQLSVGTELSIPPYEEY